MPTALLPAGLSSQSRQGVGARFVRRFGGAVRNAIAGIVRVGSLRRPAPRVASRASQAIQDPETSTPAKRPRVPRRTRTAAPVEPTQPNRRGWIARWFGLTRRQPAPSHRRPARAGKYIPFTPENHPGLTQEACDILNTPIEKLDSETLILMFAGLARHIADNMPSGSGLTDPQVVFSALWGRIGGALGHAARDTGEQPGEEPNAAADVAPAESPISPGEQPEAPMPALPHGAAIAGMTASQTAPDPVRPNCALPGSQSLRHVGNRTFRRRRALCSRSPRNAKQRLPTRRLCYAACAGPP